MKLLRPFLRWTFLVALLAGVGYVTFLIVRHRPRCTITGPYDVVHFSSDGARVLTVVKKPTKTPGFGPLLVWDTHSGSVMHTLLEGVEIKLLQAAPDNRHVAIRADDGIARVLDWHTGETWSLEAPRDVAQFVFSTHGRWLFVRFTPAGGMLIDMAARQMKLRLDEESMQFSSDERWGFTPRIGAESIAVWDLVRAQQIAALPAKFGGALVSPDGRSVATALCDEEAKKPVDDWDWQAPRRAVDVWSLPEGRKRFRVDATKSGVLMNAVFSPNNQRLAIWVVGSEQTCKLQMLNAETGQQLWDAPIRDAHGVGFTPDGTLFHTYQGTDNDMFTIFDVATGDVLWSRPVRGLPLFVVGTGLLLYKESLSTPLEWLDPRTGEHRGDGPKNFSMTFAVPTPDGRHFLLNGWQGQRRELYFWERWLEKWLPGEFGDGKEAIVILESTTGRELFRVVNRGTHSRRLSDDGSILVTVDLHPTTRDAVIRVWDMHPRRAWTWAVGVAAGTWLGAWSLRRLWRIARSRSTDRAEHHNDCPLGNLALP
jgi:hypothetical protein